MAYSDRFRPEAPRRRGVSVKEALAVLRDAGKGSRFQSLVKSIEAELEGADAGQRDKAEVDTPGRRAAERAAPNLDGQRAVKDAGEARMAEAARD